MKEEILKLLEQNKLFIAPETYKQIQDNLGKLPEEAQVKILDYLKWADEKMQLVDKFQDNKQEILKESLKEIDTMSKKIDERFHSALKNVENADGEMSSEEADELIKQI